MACPPSHAASSTGTAWAQALSSRSEKHVASADEDPLFWSPAADALAPVVAAAAGLSEPGRGG